jgi:Fur family zinc uptake transcriptional regulator
MTKARSTKSSPAAAAPAATAAPGVEAKKARREAIGARLAEAAQLCSERGLLLTPLRREVLKLLLERGGSAKAYDLHDDMRNLHGRVAPMTVYRALDFLMQAELVHRVDSLNVFVACTHGEGEHHAAHHTLMLVCTQCGKVAEEHAQGAADSLRGELADRLGFLAQALEVKGLCRACAQPASAGRATASGATETRRAAGKK